MSVYFHIRRGVRRTESVSHPLEKITACLIRTYLSTEGELMSVAEHVVRKHVLRSVVHNGIYRIFVF